MCSLGGGGVVQQSDESDTTKSSTANASNNEEITEDAADVTQTEEEDLGKVSPGEKGGDSAGVGRGTAV